MNHLVAQQQDGSIAASELPNWALSHGVTSLDTAEVARLIGVPAGQVSQRMAAHTKSGRVFAPARGLWFFAPVERIGWGAPEPERYIDAMMSHLGIDYCVGWLSSAAVHGARHQAAQVFQVATSRPVRNRVYGRSRLQFFARAYVGSCRAPYKTAAFWRAKVASVGTTMLMLASDPLSCAGISNVATAVVELAEENTGFSRDLLADAPLFPDAAARRVGWLLDEFGEGAPKSLARYCGGLSSEPSFLAPATKRTGTLDKRWNVIVNTEVEPDL